MHKGFYYKLAFTNLGKNRKFYLPYMLSCILMVMLHFILCSLSYTDTWQTIPESAIVYTILNLGCYVVEIFALILLFYTNGFLMKRRKREFGLYNVLGMEKRHIGRVLFWETFFAFSASILVGLGLGILLSKLAELLLCNMLQFEIRYAWEFIPRAFLRTGSIFLLYAALMLLHSLWQLRKAKPVELLHSVSAGEREPRANWLLALVGLVLLGAGYWLAITIQNPVDALVWFFVAVILVILGTYACFIAGSVVVLKLLRRMKGYYYKTNHFISVGGMLHRMKQNGAGLATICILSTMVLVMVSGTASLYVGNSDILHNRYPREFNFTCRGDVEASMAAAEQASQEALTARGLAAQTLLRYRYAAFTALQEEDAFLLDIAGQLQSPTGIDGRIMELYLIPLEDYNRSTGQTLALGPDQILVHQNRRQYGRDTLTLAGRTFQVAGELPEFLDNGFSTADIVTSLFIVTPDYDTLEALRASVNASYGDGGSIAVQGYYCFDTGAEKAMQIELYSAIRESVRSRGQEDMTLESRANEEWGFFSLFGGLFFLGIFLGFLFLLATVLIIYYKQITEGYEDQTRFRTLQQVGMSKAEVRRTIHSQILTVFFLPLLGAGLHTVFAFPMISKMLLLFSLTDQTLQILTTAVTFLLFGVIYTAVYLLTSRFYYRIVTPARS